MASRKAYCWIFNYGKAQGKRKGGARLLRELRTHHRNLAESILCQHLMLSDHTHSSPTVLLNLNVFIILIVKKVALNRKEFCQYSHQGFLYHQLSMRCLGRCVGVGVCTCLFIAFHRGLRVNARFEVSKQLRKDFHEPILPPFRLYLFLACQYMTFVYTDQPTFCSWKTV